MKLTGLGLYTFSEAARLIGSNTAELRRWLGSSSRVAKSNNPLWKTELAESNLDGISFHDLLELRFVKEFRAAGVSLQTIRIAAGNARELYNSDYPFTCRRFQTDGKTIFSEALRKTQEYELLDLKKKQLAFNEIIRPSLYHCIDFGENDLALRWYPTKNKQVALDPSIAFGKPIVHAVGLRTDILYESYLAEEKDRKLVARIFNIPTKAVEEAIRFEERLAA